MKLGPIKIGTLNISKGCFALMLLMLMAAGSPPNTKVVILAREAESGQRIARHIAAELQSMGFAPLILPAQTITPWNPETLESVATQNGAIAAITVIEDKEAPVVWISDRTTGKLLRRQVHTGPEEGPRVMAIRVVELLRASLLELEATHQITSEVKAPPAAKEVAADSLQPQKPKGYGALSIGAGIAFSPGGFSPSGVGIIEGSYVPYRRLGISVLFAIPFKPATAKTDEGKMELWSGLMGIALKIKFIPPANPWNVDLNIGWGGQLTIAKGEPNDGFKGRTEQERSMAPYLKLSASRKFLGPVSIEANGLAAAVFPRLKATDENNKTLTWGLPWLALTLGLNAGW